MILTKFNYFITCLLVSVSPLINADMTNTLACEGTEVRFLEGNTLLDPACHYHAELRITKGHTHLDCRGATLDGQAKIGFGIRIDSLGQVLNDIEIRHCNIINYRLNGILVTWGKGDRDKLMETNNEHILLYQRTPQQITISDSNISNSGRVGVYLDDYVSNSILSGLTIVASGGPAIYLEHSTQAITIKNSIFDNNQREAIAIDSSSHNVIEANVFTHNQGGVFLYRNCQERIHSDPQTVPRWQHAAYNHIINNQFNETDTAVWLASRQSKNLQNFDCGDTPLADSDYYRDNADNNTVAYNQFSSCAIGVRVEDDNNEIKANTFKDCAQAILIGSDIRQQLVHSPIIGTKVSANYWQDNMHTVVIPILIGGSILAD